MSRLWLSNVPPEATDDDLKELAKKYAPDLECVQVQREAGDGTRPVAFMLFKVGELGAVERLAGRLNGLFWKERTLKATTIL
jgi:RNA recognition motif-containing protein